MVILLLWKNFSDAHADLAAACEIGCLDVLECLEGTSARKADKRSRPGQQPACRRPARRSERFKCALSMTTRWGGWNLKSTGSVSLPSGSVPCYRNRHRRRIAQC